MPCTASQSCLTCFEKMAELDMEYGVMTKLQLSTSFLIPSNAIYFKDKSEDHLINPCSSIPKTSKSLAFRKTATSPKRYLPKAMRICRTERSLGLKTKSSNHCARRFHHLMSDQGPQFMPKGSQGSDQNNHKCDATTNFPEKSFCPGGVDDASQIHAVLGHWLVSIPVCR